MYMRISGCLWKIKLTEEQACFGKRLKPSYLVGLPKAHGKPMDFKEGFVPK